MGTVSKKDKIRNKELLDYKVHIRTTKIIPVLANNTTQKMKFSIQDFFIFCAVNALEQQVKS